MEQVAALKGKKWENEEERFSSLTTFEAYVRVGKTWQDHLDTSEPLVPLVSEPEAIQILPKIGSVVIVEYDRFPESHESHSNIKLVICHGINIVCHGSCVAGRRTVRQGA